MEWKNVNLDLCPDNGQEVLLSLDGIYYRTVFDADERVFKLKNGHDKHFVIDNHSEMHWLEIEAYSENGSIQIFHIPGGKP